MLPRTRVLVYEKSKRSVLEAWSKPTGDFDIVKIQNLQCVAHYEAWSQPLPAAPAMLEPISARKTSHLVFINQPLRETDKAVLSGLLLWDCSVVLGPKCANDFTWQLKSEANAHGQIFEVAETSSSLKKLFAATLGAFRKRQAITHRYDVLKTTGVEPKADALGVLPGVEQATKALRSERGRLDAEKIRALFTLSRADLARITGVQEETIRQTPDSERLQPPLRNFERVARLLAFNSDPANFATWLHTANDELDGKTPLAVIRDGNLRVVAGLVDDILTNRAR